jgi:hypothetical protein
VFGVVGEGGEGLLGYLERVVPVTAEVLSLAAPADPTEVFRVAAPCAGAGCRHHDGDRCRLAVRVARQLPAVATALPPCPIRHGCRWWAQEGRAACLRCPQVVSSPIDPSDLLVGIADPDAPTPPAGRG